MIKIVLGNVWYSADPRAVSAKRSQFFAPVAQFRCVELAQLLSGGDDIGGSEWDPRSFGQKSPARAKLFWLAVEACVAL